MGKKRLIFGVILLLLAVFLGQFMVRNIFPLKYRAEILENCVEYELDPSWVSAVIYTESKFNPSAISSKGAVGLMQIMDKTGAWVADENKIQNYNLYRAADNIKIGCAYLRMLLDQYQGSSYLALCAYNAGEGHVDEWLKKARSDEEFKMLLFDETRNYTQQVERYQRYYQILYWRNNK